MAMALPVSFPFSRQPNRHRGPGHRHRAADRSGLIELTGRPPLAQAADRQVKD
jgi:hypothetical protein